MTLNTDQVNDKLQHILGTLRDGEKGFAEAAEHAKDASLQSLFQGRSTQRAEMARAVEAKLTEGGEHARKEGSVGAALHRTWINVRDAVTGRDDASVVAEVERGEDTAVKNYQDVLGDANLPADVRSMIEGQFAQVKASHDEISTLKHQWEAKKS
ncbi:aldehyde dehydrogenase [Deinococcus irradiatisoli]|uniref:Aldehyde dehydrogenase n=1 Tax=Deinococcus irradiatisoli TaxID=2202254 RepID=A0A2Z3JA10_9DEIO|nr:PA2169 family four-helix-bundle protein [Deinococcus irradiatisoli]AWN21947.1 aldehyde dehydrogenase [Deinococcus irradiatisoli]